MKELYDSYTYSIDLLNSRIRELQETKGNENRILKLMAMRRDTYIIRRMIARYLNENDKPKRRKFKVS